MYTKYTFFKICKTISFHLLGLYQHPSVKISNMFNLTRNIDVYFISLKHLPNKSRIFIFFSFKPSQKDSYASWLKMYKKKEVRLILFYFFLLITFPYVFRCQFCNLFLQTCIILYNALFYLMQESVFLMHEMGFSDFILNICLRSKIHIKWFLRYYFQYWSLTSGMNSECISEKWNIKITQLFLFFQMYLNYIAKSIEWKKNHDYIQ